MSTVTVSTDIMNPSFNNCAHISNLEGKTVKEALSILRDVGQDHFGSIGTCTIYLSDETSLQVNLTSYGSTREMGSQRIERVEKFDELVIRRYKW